MNKEHLITQDHSPHISIASCAGELVVKSWSDTAVSLKGDDFNIEEDGNSYSITSQGKLHMRVPEKAQLSVQSVQGDLVIKFINGDITVGEVSGDLVVSGVRFIKINTVHNDLSAKNVDDSIHAEEIHGDISVRHTNDVNFGTVHGDISARYVNNAVHIQQVMGDLGLKSINGDIHVSKGHRDIILRNIGGKVVVEHTHGDIRLYGSLSAADHTLTAERDIILRWPTNAPLNLVAHAPKIKNRLPLEKVVENEDGLVGSIGDGQTQLSLKANGRIILNEEQMVDARWEMPNDSDVNFDFSFDLEGITNQIRDRFSNEINRFSSEIESKLGPDFGQQLSERLSKKLEHAATRVEKAASRAAQQAERAASRATSQAERAANQARRQAEYTTRRSPGRPPGSGKAANPPTPPSATTEEKLEILKMVEKGIITPDEAATLLEALG